MGMKTIMFSAALLALLAGMSGAQATSQCASGGTANALAPWYCSQINQAVEGIWASWAPIAAVTISLAFLIAAVIFMIGAAMRNDKVRNFGIGEMYEAAATAIIAILFLSLCAVLFGLLPAITSGPVNPYVTALTYISNTVSTTQATLSTLWGMIVINMFYASLSVTFVGTTVKAASPLLQAAPDIIFQTAKAVSVFFTFPAIDVAALLADGLLALSAEFYLILFFMYAAIPVFLMPGIILRAIFPLRGVGGVLIAVAISFYLVMPLLFSVAYYFTSTSAMGQLNAANAALLAHGQGTLAQSNADTATSPLVTDVKGLSSDMGSFFLSVLFYPGLILAITYVAMREIAEFIGGVSKISGKMSLL